MGVNRLNIVFIFSLIIFTSCSSKKTEYFDIEYAHYWWHYQGYPDTIHAIKVLQYGYINQDGECQGIIIKRDEKDYFKKFRIEEKELSNFMKAVNSLEHDTIIFNGSLDDLTLVKFVILNESTRRTITFPVHEYCKFAHFRTYLDSCFFNTDDDLQNNIELLQMRDQFIKEVSLKPDQDGFLRF
jgi:hypothetical protein